MRLFLQLENGKRCTFRLWLRIYHEYVRWWFATIPAYLRDLFGTQQVGAIHGRLLTAWSLAGVAGPVLVNYIREYQIGQGVPKAEAYSVTMYIMAGLLIIGFICNYLVTAVDEKWHVPTNGGK